MEPDKQPSREQIEEFLRLNNKPGPLSLELTKMLLSPDFAGKSIEALNNMFSKMPLPPPNPYQHATASMLHTLRNSVSEYTDLMYKWFDISQKLWMAWLVCMTYSLPWNMGIYGRT